MEQKTVTIPFDLETAKWSRMKNMTTRKSGTVL